MGIKLTYDKRDEGKVFKKPQWGDDLAFSWCEEVGYYGYCYIVRDKKKERILFKEPYNSENRKAGYKVSKVGDGVLACKLELIADLNKKGKKEMSVDFIGGKYNVVEVQFVEDGENGKVYTFKIDEDLQVKEGQMVVTEGNTGFGLARIVKYHNRDIKVETMKIFNKAKAWVVDLIDERRQNQRREATERRKFILKQLEEKKQAMEEVEIYKVLASNDPDAAKLIAELEAMGK